MPAVPVPECWITRRLTVKLRGRAAEPDWSRGRNISPSARGDTTALHGTLQRLLDAQPRHAPLCPLPTIQAPQENPQCTQYKRAEQDYVSQNKS